MLEIQDVLKTFRIWNRKAVDENKAIFGVELLTGATIESAMIKFSFHNNNTTKTLRNIVTQKSNVLVYDSYIENPNVPINAVKKMNASTFEDILALAEPVS